MPLHIRGIVSASVVETLAQGEVRAELDAASDGPTSTVVHQQVAALVTQIDEDEVLPSRANLLGHTRVLEAAGAHVTVAPMRFGTVVPDAGTLIEHFLAPEHERLRGTLERVDGHVELRLRGHYEETAVVRSVVAGDPTAARLQGRGGVEDRIKLGERVVAGIEARRERDRAAVVDVLAPFAAQIEAGEVAESLDAFQLSCLVARDQLDAFDARVEALADAVAELLHLELIGPMPPFTFTVAE